MNIGALGQESVRTIVESGAFKKKAFAMLDELSASGLDDKAIGLVLLGMAVSALTEGAVTREMIHQVVDQILNERAAA